MKAIKFKTDIKSCARCGGDHDGMPVRPLSTAMDIIDPTSNRLLAHYGFWAECPTTFEPIMITVLNADQPIISADPAA